MRNTLRAGAYAILLILGFNCSDSTQTPAVNVPVVVSPNDFLSGSKYTSLVIEIVSVTGFAPSGTAVNNLKAFLQARLNKSAGITVTLASIASPGKSTYSLADVQTIEGANRKQKTSGTILTAFFFFADADYSGNSGSAKVLGIAYGSSSMALFEKTVTEFSGGVGEPSVSTLETAVMNHEFGHILGLVNNGTSMISAHQDTANGKHCNDSNCLMYFNVETSDVIGNLLGGSVPGLDANCIADLQGNGGK